jgi:predicted RNase H-like HicB family nuclease
MNSILVKAEWDPEVDVWVATSDDLPGLAAEAKSLEDLRKKVLLMAADLIEMNCVDVELSEIPVQIVTHSLDRVGNPKAA